MITDALIDLTIPLVVFQCPYCENASTIKWNSKTQTWIIKPNCDHYQTDRIKGSIIFTFINEIKEIKND